ncbi:MAG TPA: DNA topoisomerase IV subunit B [Rhodospirillaceae bacterium]|nr:MAG: DNA topoisomerase IV subunit B [Alphaproteobacteria bacterium GWF2_58_20]HAU28956.1 DNA topoisomerase IV subunit B [Rhodospirillaceae bacterium]
MNELFDQMERAGGRPTTYTAKDIEVLEGLEPVRKRPGMYIGGTDETALHHLVAEILDNSMDEAVAGHASRIELEIAADYSVTIRDNGRGIPVEEHPKYPGKSALEVILTTLHSGGKFGSDAYKTSGGLHGVGLSVVNALSDRLVVEVARDRQLWRQSYSRGKPVSPLENLGPVQNRRGTTVIFHPDPEIFTGGVVFHPERLHHMARSKAYLFRGVEIRFSCDPVIIRHDAPIPATDTFHFPEGLQDFLSTVLEGRETITPTSFSGLVDLPDDMGRVEWALAWPEDEEGFCHSYCNTIPTPNGGTHETGLRGALAKGLRVWGEMSGNKHASHLTPDDITGGCAILLSLFLRNPQFQGQTKDKLTSSEATRLVEGAIKDHFDHWLSADPAKANALLEKLIEKAEERQRRKQNRDTARKSATRRLRLPGKLTDCARTAAEGTEIFIVEGDSAGGSAKQARDRETQAILPLRGKILNVASATSEKMRNNQEISNLTLALGCGSGKNFDIAALRYERIIIMTDADVDGAHIATLLLTFFYQEMKPLLEKGHVYLALPPLYRLATSGKVAYANDDEHKDRLLATLFKGRTKVEISRFKGLGEMPAQQLKETTMDREKRNLMRVTLPSCTDPETVDMCENIASLVERLMGRNPEMRFQFIQENAQFAHDLDV